MEALISERALYAYAAAFVWGGIWAAFHQFIPFGRFISRKHTWMTVISGCGGNLFIAYLAIDLPSWLIMWAIFACSSFFVGVRALYNDQVREEERVKDSGELKEKVERLLREIESTGGGLNATGTGGKDDSQEAD